MLLKTIVLRKANILFVYIPLEFACAAGLNGMGYLKGS